MMYTFDRHLIFASVFPYGLYALYFLWAYSSGRERLGEAPLGYLFLLAFLAAAVISAACAVISIVAIIRLRVRGKTLKLIMAFIVSNALWWPTWFVYGNFLQTLPFAKKNSTIRTTTSVSIPLTIRIRNGEFN